MDPTLCDPTSLPMLLTSLWAWVSLATHGCAEVRFILPGLVQSTSSAVTCGGPVDATFSLLFSIALQKNRVETSELFLLWVVGFVLFLHVLMSFSSFLFTEFKFSLHTCLMEFLA